MCPSPSRGAPLVWLNTLRPRQNGRHFADDIFKCIFLNENVLIPIQIPLKFIPKGLINNIPLLVQIMTWRWPGDKPLSEPMMVSLLLHICITRPKWVTALACWPAVCALLPCAVNNPLKATLLSLSLKFITTLMINSLCCQYTDNHKG